MFIKINHVEHLLIFICKFKLFNIIFYKVFCSAIYLFNGVDKCLNIGTKRIGVFFILNVKIQESVVYVENVYTVLSYLN